jgi:hypothetical protein
LPKFASDHAKVLELRSKTLGRGANSEGEGLAQLVDRFVGDILEMLVCENAVVREAVKEILGSELSTGMYPLFFRHLEITITKLFGNNGEIICNERTSLHIEQAISVLKLILERTNDHSEDLTAVDFGTLVLAYAKYLNRLGRGHVALRIKVKLCQLVDVFLSRKDYLSLREDIKFRNKMLETLVEWTSGFATVKIYTPNDFKVKDFMALGKP